MCEVKIFGTALRKYITVNLPVVCGYETQTVRASGCSQTGYWKRCLGVRRRK
jgi:hypothetical protein